MSVYVLADQVLRQVRIADTDLGASRPFQLIPAIANFRQFSNGVAGGDLETPRRRRLSFPELRWQ
ncbi:hypothetical protein JVX93_11615 [Mycolicibacterium boenickei]|nr:hypothetical protein JVX93_11615 [Mycolicibacterium boenickei]